jgi:hypothetical protein
MGGFKGYQQIRQSRALASTTVTPATSVADDDDGGAVAAGASARRDEAISFRTTALPEAASPSPPVRGLARFFVAGAAGESPDPDAAIRGLRDCDCDSARD